MTVSQGKYTWQTANGRRNQFQFSSWSALVARPRIRVTVRPTIHHRAVVKRTWSIGHQKLIIIIHNAGIGGRGRV